MDGDGRVWEGSAGFHRRERKHMSDVRYIARANAGGVQRAGAGGYIGASATRDGAGFTADWLHALAAEGRIFVASDADQNDLVLGQTSFVNTTPTFLLNVPDGSVAIPLYVSLTEAGSVAGDYIDVLFEIDNIAAYASAGTAETVLSARTDHPTANLCTLYSNPTATAGYGVLVDSFRLAEDVDPASADAGLPFGLKWKPPYPMYLVGPASLKIFTFAASTGPSWAWSIAWAELPETALAS